MKLESSKNLGGVGALLIFLGPLLNVALPRVGAWPGLLSLVGMILVLIALKGFADHYREAGIFNNALYAIIAAIVGAVVFAAVLIIAFVGFFAGLGLNISNFQDWASLSSIDWQGLSNLDFIFSFIGVILLGVIVLFVFMVITVIFLRRSLSLMAAKTGVGLFGTTGLLLLIGAILTIFVVGILVVWIAILLLAIAFFSIRPQQAPPTASTPTQPPTQA
jgi:uncharacterized membrane protein